MSTQTRFTRDQEDDRIFLLQVQERLHEEFGDREFARALTNIEIIGSPSNTPPGEWVRLTFRTVEGTPYCCQEFVPLDYLSADRITTYLREGIISAFRAWRYNPDRTSNMSTINNFRSAISAAQHTFNINDHLTRTFDEEVRYRPPPPWVRTNNSSNATQSYTQSSGTTNTTPVRINDLINGITSTSTTSTRPYSGSPSRTPSGQVTVPDSMLDAIIDCLKSRASIEVSLSQDGDTLAVSVDVLLTKTDGEVVKLDTLGDEITIRELSND